MTGDDFGLAFFTQDGRTSADRPSVFSAVDQGDMIARLDATLEDDLESPFFDDSIQEVEDAALRMFDIGIRSITDDPSSQAAPGGFGAVGPRDSGRVAGHEETVDAPVISSVVSPAGDLAHDAQARAAFTLGGPAALRSN